MKEFKNDDVAAMLVQDLLKEKRTDRRWKNVRFIAWFALFTLTIISIFCLIRSSSSDAADKGGDYVALIRLDGMIAPGREFSAEALQPSLRKAFADKHAKGVIIAINSPGGTPVQSAIIHDIVLAYKKKFHKKVIVVGEDLLTSGAYYVAVAADKIYVNPNTLTGSIGVVMKGFGFVELMKKVGIERRVYIAGDDKDRLDPFLPQTPQDQEKIHQVMSEVHANFAQAVMQGRAGKLKGDPKALFTGDFWSGQKALELGLVDELGNLLDAMDKEFHTSKYKEYSSTPGFFRMLSGQLNSAFDALFYY